MHGLRGRDIFYRNWCSPVHQLWSRDLFDSSKSLIKLDVQRMYVKLQLACGELSFDELHLQRRINRARWRHVHSVRGRKVQGVNRIGHVHGLRGGDVFCSNWCSPVHQLLWNRDLFDRIRGLIKHDMQRLSVKLQLACGERELRGSTCRHLELESSISDCIGRELGYISEQVHGPEWERTCRHAAGRRG